MWSQPFKILIRTILFCNAGLMIWVLRGQPSYEVESLLIQMFFERSIPYINLTKSFQPESHLNESILHFNWYWRIVFASSMPKFLSEYYWWYHDSSNIDYLLRENFNKESKSCSQLSDKENRKSGSNPSKTNDFENEELFLLEYFVNVNIQVRSRSLLKHWKH